MPYENEISDHLGSLEATLFDVKTHPERYSVLRKQIRKNEPIEFDVSPNMIQQRFEIVLGDQVVEINFRSPFVQPPTRLPLPVTLRSGR